MIILWSVVLAAFLFVNALGALLFVKDKRDAVAGRRRVPERALISLAALGAAGLMIWLSGRIRHKTRKQPFRTILRAVFALQILAAIGALFAALAFG